MRRRNGRAPHRNTKCLGKRLAETALAGAVTMSLVGAGMSAAFADTLPTGEVDADSAQTSLLDQQSGSSADEGGGLESLESVGTEVDSTEALVPDALVDEGVTVDPSVDVDITPFVLEPRKVGAGIQFGPGVTRLAGPDRYSTSSDIASLYPSGVKAAFVATGRDFPDALSASAAASLDGSPLLLATRTGVPSSALDELRRLDPDVIYVLGGTGALGESVVSVLSQFAPVTRIGGLNRYDTSLKVSQQIFQSSTFAVVATGRSFPDALSASGVAGLKSAPVLLVNGTATTAGGAVVGELRRLGVKQVMVAGGTGAVSKGIEQDLRNRGFSVVRRGGEDRYATSSAINAAYFQPGIAQTFLATGQNFPDALSGAALAGALSSPLFVTRLACVPPAVKTGMDSLGAPSRVVFGGTGAVSTAAANGTACQVKPPTTKPPTTKPPTTSPSGPPPGSRIVTAGAFCKKSEAGQVGYTKNGIKKVCKTSATESRYRWR